MQPSTLPQKTALSPQSIDSYDTTGPHRKIALQERAVQLSDMLHDREKNFKQKLRDLERSHQQQIRHLEKLHLESTQEITQTFMDLLDFVLGRDQNDPALTSPHHSQQEMQPLNNSVNTEPYNSVNTEPSNSVSSVPDPTPSSLNPVPPTLDQAPSNLDLMPPTLTLGPSAVPAEILRQQEDPVPAVVEPPTDSAQQKINVDALQVSEQHVQSLFTLSDDDTILSDIPSTELDVQEKLPEVSQMATSSQTSPAKDKLTRWSESEEDCMIDILHDEMQKRDPNELKCKMWLRASERMNAQGYDRTGDQMAAKWSMHTRQKCEARGQTWAASVMSKIAFERRKSKLKRPADFVDDHESDSLPAPNSKVKSTHVRKRAKRSSVISATDPDLSNSAHLLPGSRSKSNPLSTKHKDQLHLHSTWGYASNDMIDVDWSPDGKYFVAASTSNEDNRPKNLLFGSLPSQSIKELPDHRLERPERNSQGQKEYVYQTVSAVRYAKSGRGIFSAGYDGVVRVWDIENESTIRCRTKIPYPHQKRLEVMDVADTHNVLLATGTDSGTSSIRVFLADSDLNISPYRFRPLTKDFNKVCHEVM